MPITPSTRGFIEVTDAGTDEPTLINVSHINAVRNRNGATHIGINNAGAAGFTVVESYAEVAAKIRTAVEEPNRSQCS